MPRATARKACRGGLPQRLERTDEHRRPRGRPAGGGPAVRRPAVPEPRRAGTQVVLPVPRGGRLHLLAAGDPADHLRLDLPRHGGEHRRQLPAVLHRGDHRQRHHVHHVRQPGHQHRAGTGGRHAQAAGRDTDAQGRVLRGQGTVLAGHRGDRGRHPARHRHRALRAQAARQRRALGDLHLGVPARRGHLHDAGHRGEQRAPLKPECGGRAEPAVPGAAVHLRRLLPVQQSAQGDADGGRALPAQMALPGTAGGAPAGLAAARGAGAQLGTRQGGTGAHRMARWKLDSVPKNVPLAKRHVAVPEAQHAWNRAGMWDAYFAVVLAATLLIVLTAADPVAARAVAAVSLGATVPLYILVGRPAIAADRDTRIGTLYVICLVVLIVIAQTQVGASSWVMFAACPQCFMAMPLPRALAAVVALNVTPVVVAVTSIRDNPGAVASVLGTVALGLAFSLVFGTWIVKIIEQSKERAELISRLEAAQAELAEVSRQAGTLAERQRLAGEIHDTLAQGLTSIVMLLQAADTEIGSDPAEARRHVGLATQTAREGLAEARAMVAALAPAHLEGGPLHEALGRLTDRIGAELGIAVRFEVCGPARPMSAGAEVVLLRAAQEALANVRKHAHAADVRVVLSYEPQAVRLDIRDDGAGFDPEQVTGGYGLRGMRSRILQVGGSLLVRARPGAGTSLSVEV